MESTNSKIERRKHIRLIQDIPLSIKRKESLDFNQASSKDISEGGIFVEAPFLKDESFSTLYQPRSIIDLNIDIPKTLSKIRLAAELVWIKRSEKGPEGFGAKFVDVVPLEKNRLSSYIQERLKPQRKKFTFEKTVYLTDTNAEGNVYFARYFDWQGMAREEFVMQNVPSLLSIIQSGIKFITVNASAEFKHEAVLYDQILIDIKTADIKKMSLELIFTFTNKRTDQLIAVGREKLAWADPTGKLIPIPDDIRENAKYFLAEEDPAQKR